MNNESVGKKIVEALKKQAETMDLENNSDDVSLFDDTPAKNENFINSSQNDDIFAESEQESKSNFFDDIETEKEPAFISDSKIQLSEIESATDSFEMPSNILVLKKLISQLPSGVSRHTGAQIIKQTMEALGISMKSVLQDAQQVQEGLKASARECQGTIQEYKKQILFLERQSQNYQKQYSALNDLISLFIQTTK
ncbi:MAG: hypothetical protein MJ230_05600 [bacterium]|nr:hypothetical protein [bacterium]